MSAALPELADKIVNVHDLVLDGTKVGWYPERIKAWQRGENTAKWNEAKWVAEAFDQSGLLTVLMEANAMTEKLSRGRAGLSVITGDQISRYASRNIAGATLGPTFDLVGDVATLGRTAGPIIDTIRGVPTNPEDRWVRGDTRAVRKIIPLQNLLYLRWLFDRVEEGVNEGLRLPARRTRN